MSMLRLARVAAVHPEDNSVDIVMVDDGSRYPGVQVLATTATTNCGNVDLPDVTATSDKFSLTQSTDRDSLAVIGFLAPTVPVVLGFMFPQVNQVLFPDQNRRIIRHASDLYSSTDNDANFELYHPSGTFVRIGTAPAHEDLTGRDFDGLWKISKNTDKAVNLHIEIANGGEQKAALTIDPSGNITLSHIGNLTWHTQGTGTLNVDGDVTATLGGKLTASVSGNASITVGGTTSVTSTGAATIKAPTVKVDAATSTFTGAVIVQGLLTYSAGMAGSGGSGGASANITGNVAITSGDVSADGIKLKVHHHQEHDGPSTGPALA